MNILYFYTDGSDPKQLHLRDPLLWHKVWKSFTSRARDKAQSSDNQEICTERRVLNTALCRFTRKRRNSQVTFALFRR